MTNDTTAQATVLSDEQLDLLQHDLLIHIADCDIDGIAHPTIVDMIDNMAHSHRALTEQVRVLEWELAVAKGDADEYDMPDDVQKIIARSAHGCDGGGGGGVSEKRWYEVDVQLEYRVRFTVEAANHREAIKQVSQHYKGEIELGEPMDVAEGSFEPDVVDVRIVQP